jgi:putative flippase GtrA
MNGYQTLAYRIISHFFTAEFIKFLIVGGFSAVINFGSRFAFERLVHNFTLSVSLGYIAGTLSSFFLNRSITFQVYSEKMLIQLTKFFIAAIIITFFGSLFAFIMVNILLFYNIPILICKLLAHISAIGLTTIINYFVIKYICFKKIL